MLKRTCLALLLLSLPVGLPAQIAVPPLGGTVDGIGSTVNGVLQPVREVVRSAGQLAQDRTMRLAQFVARNSRLVEYDAAKQPARRGELLIVNPQPADLAVAEQDGFSLIEQGTIEGVDLAYARLAVPVRVPLAKAERDLRRLLPRAEITADLIHFPSGTAGTAVAAPAGRAPLPRGGTVGVIDGGVAAGQVTQSGFAAGAPRANAHAQAIRSLLSGAGSARLYFADVYGTDPAGGNALAIARALGWMVQQQVPVVSISLVGPANPLVERAVAGARLRGVVVVAAVGNDGAAAPPAYPASYTGVIAVTGVDKRGRALFEAGRATHLDYAAPGADMTAIGLDGRRTTLRGTSFAAPLVAARLAALRATGTASPALIAAADSEALKGGARTGRGILCGGCRQGS